VRNSDDNNNNNNNNNSSSSYYSYAHDPSPQRAVTGKGKDLPITCHAGTKGEERYSSTHS
jgi:hypothetical protein